MTDREKAIVMAYTGICMLTGDKFRIYHKYVEDIMGRPVWTHEMGIKSIADEIKEKSKSDFIALCEDESNSENLNKWIPVSDPLNELPKDKRLLVTVLEDYGSRYVTELYYDMTEWSDINDAKNAVAYQYYPEPYKEVEDDRKRT